jgi:hypothetical protein
MGTPSSELPSGTQIVGQQSAPTTTVPHTPHLANTNPNNNLAMVSLITGILSFAGHIIPLVGGSTLAIVAVITGYIARNQIKESGEQGMTMASVGMILGIANLALVGVVILLLILFIFVLGIGIFGIAARNG